MKKALLSGGKKGGVLFFWGKKGGVGTDFKKGRKTASDLFLKSKGKREGERTREVQPGSGK